MKILVVEDDELVLFMLRDVLTSEGHEVITASDGRKAMEILHGDMVDLVITDIVMPFQEGVETILECKRYWKDLKIIAISGGGRVAAGDFLDMALKCGADDILKKPFRPDELLTVVKKLAVS